MVNFFTMNVCFTQGQKQDSKVNADNNGPQENHSTVASLGGECSASENMVLSKTDSTQG